MRDNKAINKELNKFVGFDNNEDLRDVVNDINVSGENPPCNDNNFDRLNDENAWFFNALGLLSCEECGKEDVRLNLLVSCLFWNDSEFTA